MITVQRAGGQTLVQDHGRPGLAASGVTRSAVFDRGALDLGNRLVGNTAAAAGLECLGGGLEFTVDRPVEVAVTGALCDIAVGHHAAAPNSVLTVSPGHPLRLGPTHTGIRAYVAVRGGIAVPPVLGSRSTDTLGRIGPQTVAAGTELPVGTAVAVSPVLRQAPVAAGDTGFLAISAGPRRDWFDSSAWQTPSGTAWVVSPRSSRVGIRLDGPALARVDEAVGRELPPEPMVRGAIQVPPDGRPIILGPDHPTTGGYPVIAVVDDPDTDRCAQLAPGLSVRFTGRDEDPVLLP